MRGFIEWLEEDNRRLRKVMAVYVTIAWTIATVAAFGFVYAGKDILAVYSLVAAAFANVVGFYMATKAETD